MDWSVEHRPFPLPPHNWSMAMVWHDLLFLHWPTSPERIREAYCRCTGRDLPREMIIDTFDGRAYFAIVPFWMSRIRHRGLPPLPGLSRFPELNVRTYVRVRGRSGVYFFTLDAHSRIAVEAARRVFRLNYLWAKMASRRDGDSIEYRSTRRDARGPAATFAARYTPQGQSYRAVPGGLEHWFTERYALFAVDPRDRIGEGVIHHAPWPLQAAEAQIQSNTMAEWLSLDTSAAPLIHFARRLDVVAWLPQWQ